MRFDVKMWLKVVLGVFLVMLVGFSAVLAYLLHLGASTRGPRIPAYASPRTALLVVDLQEDFTGPRAVQPYHDAARILKAASTLLDRARTMGMPVVLVENVFSSPVMRLLTKGVNTPGTPGVEVDHRLPRVEGALILVKHRSDAFSNPDLDAFLRRNQVGRILVVGLDGAHCVNATARGALARGYQVDMVMEGIATESDTPLATLARGWQSAGARILPAPALP
jgi:nicotinamidase-related amidase